MNSRTKIGVVLAVLLIALAAVRLGLFSKAPSDQELIRSALQDAVEACKDGRPGPVLDFLSDQFRMNAEIPATKQAIAKAIRDSHPEIVVKKLDATVSGDTATLVTPVHVKFQYMAGVVYDHEFPQVTLVFTRERSVSWLVLPSKTWRLRDINSVDAPRLE